MRIEVGPRDIDENAALLFRRDTREKNTVGLDAVAEEVQAVLARMQTEMLDAATARRDAHIADCTTLDEAREAAQTGIARLPWKEVGVLGEEELAAAGVTVRCLQRRDGTLPEGDADEGALAYVARAY